MRAALVLACCLAAASCGCSSHGGTGTLPDAHVADEAADAAPADPDAMPRPRVRLAPAGRPEAAVWVEIADTPAERERGLMYVQNLPLDEGMLFVFPTDEVQSFWMKNTLIPLDMIFIRSDLTVAGVVANAEPLTLTPRGIDEPSRYVLEVNGGWAAANGVGEGTPVTFEGITP